MSTPEPRILRVFFASPKRRPLLLSSTCVPLRFFLPPLREGVFSPCSDFLLPTPPNCPPFKPASTNTTLVPPPPFFPQRAFFQWYSHTPSLSVPRTKPPPICVSRSSRLCPSLLMLGSCPLTLSIFFSLLTIVTSSIHIYLPSLDCFPSCDLPPPPLCVASGLLPPRPPPPPSPPTPSVPPSLPLLVLLVLYFLPYSVVPCAFIAAPPPEPSPTSPDSSRTSYFSVPFFSPSP